MKQHLLLIVFLLISSISYGQLASSNGFAYDRPAQKTQQANDIDLKVYPNPATHYVYFNNYESKVNKVVFFNLVGRPIKQFPATPGKNHFDLTELSRGMYLVQLMDYKGNVISTRRLNKR